MTSPTAEEIAPGLHKTVLTPGDGTAPTQNSNVRVHYKGTLDDGTVFDTSRGRGEFQFTLGKGQVIKGWDQGVATMTIGEKAILRCAPDMAYGAHGSPPTIPANATLNFEVELLGFEESIDTIPKKIQAAEKAKAAANEAFKQNESKKALELYEKALSHLSDTFGATDEESKTLDTLKAALNSNASQACIKLKEPVKALTFLKKCTPSAKTSFKFAVAYGMMGEWNQAFASLTEAEAEEGMKGMVQAEKAKIMQKKKDAAAKERSAFAGIFA